MKGRKTGGRQKGATNRVTKQAKEAIALAAEKLGGVNRLTAWAKESPDNERVFWSTIYTKLVPVTVGGDPDNPLETITRIERVIIGSTTEDAADRNAERIPTTH